MRVFEYSVLSQLCNQTKTIVLVNEAVKLGDHLDLRSPTPFPVTVLPCSCSTPAARTASCPRHRREPSPRPPVHHKYALRRAHSGIIYVWADLGLCARRRDGRGVPASGVSAAPASLPPALVVAASSSAPPPHPSHVATTAPLTTANSTAALESLTMAIFGL